MLTAIKDNQTIFVFQHDPSLLKEWSNDKRLFCPDCHDDVIFKVCEGKQSHFAHVSKQCSFPFREPESIEHEKGKHALYEWLQGLFGSQCTIEQHIPETNQRSDLFVTHAQTAIEFQCSPIQSATWQKRHALYKEAGIRDFWILGYSMHTHPIRHNLFVHQLNQLERTLLEAYGKLVYYDVLTESFILVFPHVKENNRLYGQSYFLKPKECVFDTAKTTLTTKYDFFMQLQETRNKRVHQTGLEAKKTDQFLKQLKSTSAPGKQTLASKKQIDLIQTLLKQKKMTMPYKLHGLLRHEASTIIQELLGRGHEKKKAPQ